MSWQSPFYSRYFAVPNRHQKSRIRAMAVGWRRGSAGVCHACVMTRAQLDKRPGDVSAMFDAVAERYDLLNDVLSLGQDRRWRSVVASAVSAGPGDLVLDIAAGTG